MGTGYLSQLMFRSNLPNNGHERHSGSNIEHPRTSIHEKRIRVHCPASGNIEAVNMGIPTYRTGDYAVSVKRQVHVVVQERAEVELRID